VRLSRSYGAVESALLGTGKSPGDGAAHVSEDRLVTLFVAKNRDGAVLWELFSGTECGQVDGAVAGRQPHASAGTRRGAAGTPLPSGENRPDRGERRGTDEA
jgi:hypothetical protein